MLSVVERIGTSNEFNRLEVLVRNAGAPLGKQALSKKGLIHPLALFDRLIDVHLGNVRRVG